MRCLFFSKAGITEAYEGHKGPITAIDTHRVAGQIDFHRGHAAGQPARTEGDMHPVDVEAGHALGLLNRFAQQLNVFSLSLSIKSWAATALLLILVPLLAQAVLKDLSTRSDIVRAVARTLAR